MDIRHSAEYSLVSHFFRLVISVKHCQKTLGEIRSTEQIKEMFSILSSVRRELRVNV